MSQIIFRKRLKARGYEAKDSLTVKAQWYPWLAWFAMIIQILAMILLIFEVGDGLPIFVLSMDIIIAPIVFFQIQKYRGKIRSKIVIGADEITFDQKFPAKPGFEDKPKKPLIAKNQDLLCILLMIVTVASIVISFLTINSNPEDIAEGENIFSDPAMKQVWTYVLILVATYVAVFAGIVHLNKFKRPGADSPGADTEEKAAE